MRINIGFFVVLSLIVCCHSHSTLIYPSPRRSDPTLKTSPCGGIHPTNPISVFPGVLVVKWNETVCHDGSPFRLALALNNDDKSYSFNEYILVDHIPHNDECETGFVYSFTIQIPDIKCDHCVLQLTQMLIEKGIKQCPGSYPEQWSTYYTCADIKIEGTKPISEYIHQEQTPEAFQLDSYGYESGTWSSDGDFLGQLHYTESGYCPDELPRVCNTDFDDKRHGKKHFCVEWHVVQDKITFIIESTAMGWLSLGLSETKDISEADVYMGKVSLEFGFTTVQDMHFEKEKHIPVVDSVQNVESFTGLHIPQGEMIEDGVKVTRMTFTRKLVTGDPKDLDLAATKKVYLSWAFHETIQDFEVQHTGFSKGQLVDLFSSEPISHPINNSMTTHGWLMLFAWDIFAFGGIIVARYMRDRNRWFYAHAFLELLACILAWSSFSVIYKHVGNSGEHFKGWHPALGVFVIVFSFLQPALGLFAHCTREKNASSTESKPKKLQNKLHIYFGRIGISAALINLIAGLVLLDRGMGIIVGLGVFIFIQCLIVLVLEIRLRRSKSSKFNVGPAILDDEIDDEDEL